MKCPRCNVEKGSMILFKGKWICDNCYRITTPPTLLLTRHWTNNSLFDPARKVYLKMDLEFLKGCGYKVFRHCTYRSSVASPIYREYITLRYFSEMTCPLITNYSWPKFQPYCRSLSCRPI